MADKIPVKANYTSGVVTSLGEFQSGDTVPVANGGTGSTTKNFLTFASAGDVAARFKTLGDFTADNAWHDLDCSSVVPAGATLILFRAVAQNNTVGQFFELRKKGNTNTVNTSYVASQAVNVVNHQDIQVECDSNRFIQYLASNSGTWGDLGLVIKGWFV